MTCLYSVLVLYKLQCCRFLFSSSFILLLFLYHHICRLPKAFEMKQKSCEVSELCCHLWMRGSFLDCVQRAEQEVGMWQGGIYLLYSMWRVALHYPALSSGSPQGPTAPCAIQYCSMCIFFPSKNFWNMVITRVFGHTVSAVLTFELFHPQPQCKVEAGCKWILVFLAGSKPFFL